MIFAVVMLKVFFTLVARHQSVFRWLLSEHRHHTASWIN
jgi:hypothetical protein